MLELPRRRRYAAVTIGVSSGGVQALKRLLGQLPAEFPLPILIVQHISPDAGDGMARLLNEYCALQVKEADEQEHVEVGRVYLAPPNYHLLVERDGLMSLAADGYVSYARPSVDVLFESAAAAYGDALIGVVLTGANFDGSRGLKTIKDAGGCAVVQDPTDAEASQMPAAALAATQADHVVPLAQIAELLQRLAAEPAPDARRR